MNSVWMGKGPIRSGYLNGYTNSKEWIKAFPLIIDTNTAVYIGDTYVGKGI